MWHAIEIAENKYFFKCLLEGNSIKYYLYNLKDVWSEECSINEVIQRAKNLNKRICYDSETVLATIESPTPTTVSIEPAEYGHNLILKYHVVGRPFNFEWKLKPLHSDDFRKLITNPLFMSIHYLTEQINELKESIKKKDIEIKQYIAEGAVLQRKTVATETFDEDAFNRRYTHFNELSKGFLRISDSVRSNFPVMEVSKKVEKRKEYSSGSTTFVSTEKSKKSPNKKRKFFESRRLRMENLAKSKHNNTMEYESSQSQTLSQTPPKDELAEIFQSLDELNAKRLNLNTS